MPDRCHTCDRPLASTEDWEHVKACQDHACTHGVGLCWGDYACEPVDWRARALKAEAELAAAIRSLPPESAGH